MRDILKTVLWAANIAIAIIKAIEKVSSIDHSPETPDNDDSS